jgi:asparagine synthase (glutamine-hydrolysing)
VCGICGTTRAGDGTSLQAMNDAMKHRGPEDEGIYVDERTNVGLGVRRLSIIDVAGGHQPLSNEDGTVWAVLNGEIYNFPSLRERLLGTGHRFSSRTDTEVLVHLYEEYGVDLVHALEGMFAFALWDGRQQLLVIARDRFGEKPLFYSTSSAQLTFASELTALLQALPSRPEVDAAAIDTYFTFGYVMAPKSVVQGVTQLLPGHILTWNRDSGAVATRSYWSPPQPVRELKAPHSEIADEARELLEASVRSRLMADVPLGVFLSGGIDSTLVAALAARHSSEPLKTFTVGYDVGSVNETEAARRAAAAVGAEHHELLVDENEIASRAPTLLAALDQPLADEAFVPLRLLAEFAREEVTVIIGGEGADELFGGYPRYRWLARSARLPAAVPRRPLVAAAKVIGHVPGLTRASRLREVFAFESPLARHVAWVTGQRLQVREALYGPRLREYGGRDPLHLYPVTFRDDGDLEGSFMRLDQTHWLPDDVLVKADRASMQKSLELRTPYLSRELAELAASVPGHVHSAGHGKVILRQVFRQVIPDATHRRAKVAFRAPAGTWLRGPLAPALQEQLHSSALYAEGWFDRAAVGSLVREHLQGATDRSRILWPLFALGAWLDRFVADSS